MKRFIEGEDRGQGTLLPEHLDDFVTEDNAVRVVDVSVDELDPAGLGSCCSIASSVALRSARGRVPEWYCAINAYKASPPAAVRSPLCTALLTL